MKDHVKYDVDNRLSIKIPDDFINVDRLEFEDQETSIDYDTKTITIELSYTEIEEATDTEDDSENWISRRDIRDVLEDELGGGYSGAISCALDRLFNKEIK